MYIVYDVKLFSALDHWTTLILGAQQTVLPLKLVYILHYLTGLFSSSGNRRQLLGWLQWSQDYPLHWKKFFWTEIDYFLSQNQFSTMFWTELCVKYDNWRSFKWKLIAQPDDSLTEAVISLRIVIVGVLSSRACCNLRGFSNGIGFWTPVSMALSNLPENNTKKSSGRFISINCELFICL